MWIRFNFALDFINQNIMRKFSILSILLLAVNFAFSQIGGLSGSKLASYCVDIVDQKKIEFEPSFYYVHSAEYWNNNGKHEHIYPNSDSVINVSGMMFRFTYGLLSNLEVGISVPVNLSKSYFGARYVILEKKNFGVAAIAGFQMPMGDGIFSKHLHTEENTVQAGIGGVVSVSSGENFSVDFNAQYDRFLKEPVSTKTNTYAVSADAGYYVFNHTFQLIGSLYYEYNQMEGKYQDLLLFSPGFTLETGKNFIVVMSVPFDIYGHLTNHGVGFSFALTLTFE